MPLKKGTAKGIIDKNIEQLMGDGFERKAAIAIALDKAEVERDFNERTTRKSNAESDRKYYKGGK